MRSMLRNLLLATLPSLLLCFLALEILFRFVIPAAELPDIAFEPEAGILHYDPEGPREGTFTRGRFAQLRATWRINNRGWNSDIDYLPASERSLPLIAIVGDSYINSFQVDPDENVAAVLRELLEGRFDVYRFGFPGAPLSQYLQVSRYLDTEFDPDILIISVIHNDFHESLRDEAPFPAYLQFGRDEGGAFVEVAPQAPREGRLGPLRWSALARYWTITLRSTPMSNLKNWLLGRLPAVNNANVQVDRVARSRPGIEEVTRLVVERIRNENRDRRLIFMMDAPRLDLYAGQLEESNVRWLNDLLRDEVERAGVPFVDLRERFSETYRRTGVRFESPYDSHWNAFGHAEVACALLEKLVEIGEVAPREPPERCLRPRQPS